MYYEYLLNQAIKNNEIKEFLIGTDKYPEKPSNHADYYAPNYEDRARFICEREREKNEIDIKIADTILDLLRGTTNEFYIGICYVRSLCYLFPQNILLQIDLKQFLLSAKEVITSRKEEMKHIAFKNDFYNNMWEFVEGSNDRIAAKSGIRII